MTVTPMFSNMWKKDIYIEWLYGLGLAPTTIAVYQRQADRWEAWCTDESVDPLNPTMLDVAGFAQTLPHSYASRRQFRSVLRHYFDAHNTDPSPVTAIRMPRKKRYLSRALEPQEATRLVTACLDQHPEGTATMLGLYLGLRRNEIATAEWPRFSAGMEWYTVFGKGGVEATIPVHPVMANQLAKRMSIYRYVFPGRSTGHIAAGTISEWVRKIGETVDIPDLAPHRLRHTAIATINDATGDLRATQEFARHADPATTQIYTRVTTDRLRSAVDSLSYVA